MGCREMKEGCGLLRAESPGGSAILQVSRAQLNEVGPRMLFLSGGPPVFFHSLTSSRLYQPQTHRPRTTVDLTSCLHPGPSLASVSAASNALQPAAAAQCFLPSPSIPFLLLPLLLVLPPPRPRPLLGIPRLSVPPSILSASN